MIFLFKKVGSIFSNKPIKIQGNLDFSASDIKLEVLRNQAKLLYYNQKTAWLFKVDSNGVEIELKLQDFGIFEHKLKNIEYIDFEFIAQPSPATNHQLFIYGKDAAEGSDSLVTLILDGRFHARLNGLE